MEINLSDDLIREILLRLPRRSLARFKSVSKSWLTTISSPYFIKQYDTMNLSSFFSFVHVDHENDNNGFQQKQQLYSLRTALGTPRFSPEIKKIVTVDSSNGLILYGAAVDLKERFGTYHSFFVTNPQTNQCRFLPPSPHSVSLDQPLPRYVEIKTGFGFDHSSDPPHYIVAEIVPTDPFEVEIYSYNSVTSAWTCNRANLRLLFNELEDNLNLNLISIPRFKLISGSVFFHGKLHWVTSNGDVFVFCHKKKLCSLIQGPLVSKMRYNQSRNMKGTKIARLGESRQRLVVVALDVGMENNSFTFSSWSLEDYNKGKWVCDYWVDVGPFDNIVTKQPNYLEVVAISPLDPRILCLNLGFALYLYNVKTKEVQLLHQYKHVNVYEYWQSYCHHVVPRSPPYIDPHLYLDVLSRERTCAKPIEKFWVRNGFISMTNACYRTTTS